MHGGTTDTPVWDRFATAYTEQVFSPLQFPTIRQRIIDAVKPPRVLDLGCGPTPYLLGEVLRIPGVELYASDISNPMLEAAAKHFPARSIKFVHADHSELPFESDFFDTVISVNSILPEDRKEIEPMLAQVARVLRPGGRLVALLPAFETSLMARDKWRMKIRIDERQHREYDTTGWQCFYTRQDIVKLMKRHSFTTSELSRLMFDFKEAVEEIRKIYGHALSEEVLHKYPLFEHFLIAEKPLQPSFS
jgi:ubiquinone/menaquinone biosynthesis C-methylase UbiE